MSLPAPAYAIQVDPYFNNKPVDAILIEADSGSPLTGYAEVILWDKLSEAEQQSVIDAIAAYSGSPSDVRAALDAAHILVGFTRIPSVFPRPAAPIDSTLVYYGSGSWRYVYDDSVVA